MKISNKELILVAIGVAIVYYMYSNNKQQNLISQNQEEDLYGWVEDGEDAIEDVWDVMVQDAKQIDYYNDK